jgi:hypothetical protein
MNNKTIIKEKEAPLQIPVTPRQRPPWGPTGVDQSMDACPKRCTFP